MVETATGGDDTPLLVITDEVFKSSAGTAMATGPSSSAAGGAEAVAVAKLLPRGASGALIVFEYCSVFHQRHIKSTERFDQKQVSDSFS